MVDYLIDDSFDVALANQLAQHEMYNKHHYRPNSYLHKWWARRCGSTFRLLLKHLCENREEAAYYAPKGLDGKLILDPMMGGGTTLHEAIRMGANVIGADIDPIPVWQARATLSDVPLAVLESAFDTLQQAISSKTAPYFRTISPRGIETPIRYTLYGLKRHCDCEQIVHIDSLVLRYEKDGRRIELDPMTHEIVVRSLDESPAVGERGGSDRPRLVEKGFTHCSACNGLYRDDISTPFYARYRPLVVVGRTVEDGLFFKSLSDEDYERIESANDARVSVEQMEATQFGIAVGPKSADLHARGIRDFRQLFSSRQLIYLKAAIDHLQTVEPLVRLNLGLLVSTSLEFNVMLCGYKGGNRHRPGAIRHAFAYHAFTLPYTALENNPLYPLRSKQASGTLPKLFHDRIRRARQWAQAPRERDVGRTGRHFVTLEEKDAGEEMADIGRMGEGTGRFHLINGSSVNLPIPSNSVDFVVTDPPYFDSVQYGDLASFFHVWLRHLLAAENAPYELAASAVDPRNKGRRRYQFRAVLGGIFAECHRVLKGESGRLIFTYHQWKAQGWADLTNALRDGGFQLVNYYVVQAENPRSVHIKESHSLVHDVVLVCRPAGTATVRQWQAPAKLDRSDSYRFCAGCGELLGSLLNGNSGEDAIVTAWRKAILGDGESNKERRR